MARNNESFFDDRAKKNNNKKQTSRNFSILCPVLESSEIAL